MSVTRSLLRAALLALGLSGAACAADAPAAADINNCAKPEWPKEALRLGQHGKVTLEFLVGEDGAVRDARIAGSSGYPLLDVAAQDGIRRCRFKPATKDGQPVESWMKLQYVWTLDTTPRYDEATLKTMREAAAGGAPDAVLRLARVQLTPAQAAFDPPAAVAALRPLAARGNAAAQTLLGYCFETGTGVQRDRAQALALYTPAAAAGDADAQRGLARLNEQGKGPRP
ncbi:TonB family protein [[Empedobacter] haloabium]|uniref:TonB family protein n=1 Tax=[Empedobacter] haloabium TaxID=592317 RepID=A0ABZ1UL04_9BURK